MNRRLYGYDRHMKPIYRGSIVRFRDKANGVRRVGHVWFYEGSYPGWQVSFNHTYSEQSQPIEEGRDYRVIGDVERNPDHEELLHLDSVNHRLGIDSTPAIDWQPWPRWKEEV